MDEKLSCRDARQRILQAKDADEGEMPESLSRHLSDCEACKSHFEAMERCEGVLAAEQDRLHELARPAESDKRRLLGKITAPQVERARGRRRLVWAGATAALLLAFFGVRTFINIREREQDVPRPGGTLPAITTQSVAEAAASETVRELAAVVSRFESPATPLPYTPPEPESPSFMPRLLQECATDSDDTMRAILDSRTRLTRREET